MYQTISEFLSKSFFSFPNVPDGSSETISSFFNDCISPVLPKNKETIIKWHELLVKYINDPDAILLSRLYESRKLNGDWDTRRGMLTRMKDDFSYAYATNFFARIIYTMAYYDFIPEYDDFKTMFNERKFSLFSFMGKTEVEKNYAAFTQSPYNPRFYTQNWYLAHIVAVNDEPFFNYETYNINDIFTPGNQSDWKLNNKGFIERYLDYELNESQKRVARAHFLRFVDPINYFLVPNSKHVSIPKIGENPNIIDFMRKRAMNLYGNIYENFLENALSNPKLISTKSLEDLGAIRLSGLMYSSVQLQKNTLIKIRRKDNIKIKIDNEIRETPKKINESTLINYDLLNELSYYKQGSVDKSFSEKELNFDNDYISVVCFNHSNKWLGKTNQSDMEKMWSIIYKPKKDFSELKGWNILLNNLDISITQVSKGKNQGNCGIRIRGMKQKPNELIIRKILSYIFA